MSSDLKVYTWGMNHFGQLGNGNNTDSNVPVTSYNDQPLPVDLVSFTANAGDTKVTLKWSTASEVDNLGYAILRSASNEQNYLEIDSYLNNPQLQGAGNSSSQHNYEFVDQNLINGITYNYKLVDIDIAGQRTEHGPVSARPYATQNDDPINTSVPKKFNLYQNYPNPFNPSTRISFDIPETDHKEIKVSINVYDLQGCLIVNLFEGYKSAGAGQFVDWNGRNASGKLVPAGIYIYEFMSETYSVSRRMVLLK
jgi:type 1 fimbria pilin